MSHENFRLSELWSLRDGTSTIHIRRRRDVADQDASLGVSPGLVHWKLERWVHASPDTLRSLYEALGGIWPWQMTNLERPAHEQRVVNRLIEAFESGALIARIEELPRFAGHLPERATPPREKPPARPRPAPESPKPTPAAKPAVDAAAQARTLREAARDGMPFCEECEKRGPQPRPQQAAT